MEGINMSYIVESDGIAVIIFLAVRQTIWVDVQSRGATHHMNRALEIHQHDDDNTQVQFKLCMWEYVCKMYFRFPRKVQPMATT